MRRETIVGIVMALLATIAFKQPPIHGQTHDDGQVSVSLVPEMAEPLRTFGPPSYRVYDEPSILRVGVGFMNRSEQRILIDQQTAQNALRIRLHQIESPVQGVVEIPVVVDWLPVVRLPRQWAPIPIALVPLLVEPHEGVGWIVELQRADAMGQPFRRGAYWLEFEMFDFQLALRKPDLSAWVGKGLKWTRKTDWDSPSITVHATRTCRNASTGWSRRPYEGCPCRSRRGVCAGFGGGSDR